MNDTRSLFLLRRLYGFAQIADGLGMLVGLRFGLGYAVAKKIARVNGKRMARMITTPSSSLIAEPIRTSKGGACDADD